jgi:tight adherence protein B
MDEKLLLLLVIGGGLTLLILIASFWSEDTGGGAFKKRLARVGGIAPVRDLKEQARAASLRRRTSDSDIPLFDRFIKTALPNPEKLRQRLARTGRDIALGQYLVINALAVFGFFLAFSSLADWTTTTSLFAGIALGLYLPHKITGRMGNRRVTKFLASFPEAIDTICRGLRSGLPITEMITTVGHELPAPISTEFTRISDGVRMGRPLEEAMWEAAPRLDVPEYRFFIIALAIQ